MFGKLLKYLKCVVVDRHCLNCGAALEIDEIAVCGHCEATTLRDLFASPMLKYEGNVAVGMYLSGLLGEKIASSTPQPAFDYIVPIPLHWRKKLKRGFNQSEIIARGIQKGIQDSLPDRSLPTPLVLPTLLRRKSFTATQTAKDRISRWQNVKDAFEINPACKFLPSKGNHILICDDVLTTGATLEACASILVEELGCRVSIATLAYVE